MTSIIPFSFDGNAVRAMDRDGDPWFVLADVCRVLEHSDPSKAAERLDDDEKGTNIVRTHSGDQTMLVINESGLYSLILTSRKPAAKRFKKWVTSDVLPMIRKTGRYGNPVDMDIDSPDFWSELERRCASKRMEAEARRAEDEARAAMPLPMVGADVDVNDMKSWSFPRLALSQYLSSSHGDDYEARLQLLLVALSQKPAGSLPTDDAALCRAAGFGRDLVAWAKAKDVALHGWQVCRDCRLYHPLASDIAVENWKLSDATKRRRESGAERVRRWREGQSAGKKHLC